MTPFTFTVTLEERHYELTLMEALEEAFHNVLKELQAPYLHDPSDRAAIHARSLAEHERHGRAMQLTSILSSLREGVDAADPEMEP